MSSTVTDRLKQYLEDHRLTPDDVSVPMIAGQLRVDPGEAETALQELEADPEAANYDAKGDSDSSAEQLDTNTDTGGELTAADIRDHYSRARDVYTELATVASGARTVGVDGHSGWYESRDIADIDLLEAGWTTKARPKPLPSTAEDMAADGSDRSIYTLLTYSTHYDRWLPMQWVDGERQWRGGSNPLAEYDEIAAQAIFADVDLEGEHKERPLPADTQSTVEEALTVYVEHFTALAGDMKHVYLLDSVGGAYPFIPPAATAPIANEFASEDAGQLFDELTDRVNGWLADVWADVTDRVEAADEYLDPDEVNHKSRQYKAPLSIHKSINSVVTPLDPGNIEYEHVPVHGVDDALIERCEKWADEFTDTDHAAAIESIVETLWPDHYADENDWKLALDSWLIDQAREQQQSERRRQQLQDVAGSTDGELSAAEIRFTRSLDQVQDDLDGLNIERVIEKTILGAGWTDRLSGCTDKSGSNKRAFVPNWAGSYNSGNATIANVSGPKEGLWIDTSNGYEGGPVEAALIAREGRSPSAGWASGEQWARGVEILAELGFDIPYYVPDATTPDYDRMPLWALRKLGELLDLTDRTDLVERQGEGGDTYLSLRRDAYGRVIEYAESIGFDTGRTDHLDHNAADSPYFNVDLDEYVSDESEPYTDPDAMLAACLRARDAGAVDKTAEPPTMALIPIVRAVTGRDADADMAAGTRSLAIEVFENDLTSDDVTGDGSDAIEIPGASE